MAAGKEMRVYFNYVYTYVYTCTCPIEESTYTCTYIVYIHAGKSSCTSEEMTCRRVQGRVTEISYMCTHIRLDTVHVHVCKQERGAVLVKRWLHRKWKTGRERK